MTAPLLIADDSEGKILLLRAALRSAQWEGDVLIAKTMEEAFVLIDAHPDIGFGMIDYYIPSENGPAIIRRLKEMNPDARIALVSSSDNKTNAQEAKDAGAEVCICTSNEASVVERTLQEVITEWKDAP